MAQEKQEAHLAHVCGAAGRGELCPHLHGREVRRVVVTQLRHHVAQHLMGETAGDENESLVHLSMVS